MAAKLRLFRVIALLAIFVGVGASGCPQMIDAQRSLFYDVPIDGITMEVRVDHRIRSVARAEGFFFPIILDIVHTFTVWIRDPATGEFRAATEDERQKIMAQIHIPPFKYDIIIYYPPPGPTNGILPKPAPSPPPSPPPEPQ